MGPDLAGQTFGCLVVRSEVGHRIGVSVKSAWHSILLGGCLVVKLLRALGFKIEICGV